MSRFFTVSLRSGKDVTKSPGVAQGGDGIALGAEFVGDETVVADLGVVASVVPPLVMSVGEAAVRAVTVDPPASLRQQIPMFAADQLHALVAYLLRRR